MADFRGECETPLKAGMIGGEFAEAAAANSFVAAGQMPTGLGGTHFGETGEPGERHADVTFSAPVEFGALYLSHGPVAISYRETEGGAWKPLSRMTGEWKGTTEQADKGYTFWYGRGADKVKAQALRFSREISPDALRNKDGVYETAIGGVYLFPSRLVNVAPLGTAVASSGPRSAKRTIDGMVNFGQSWQSEPNGKPLSEENPQWVGVTWPSPARFRCVGLDYPCFNAAEIQVCTAPATVAPRDARPGDWKTVKTVSNLHSRYPTAFRTAFVDLGKAVTTRGVRVLVTAPMVTSREHPHNKKFSQGGTAATLDELFVLAEPADAKALRKACAPVETEAPGVPVAFDMPFDGLATLVVETPDGRRVRNLAAARPFAKGRNVVKWDCSDDLLRDVDAANHGLYSIPKSPVAPGDYVVRGVAHKGVRAIYEMSSYYSGKTPWSLPDHTGAWIANHGDPRAACLMPARGDRPEWIAVGSNVTEGPDGLAFVTPDGVKVGGRKWIGGAWTCAAFLAYDAGESPIEKHLVYVGGLGISVRKTLELRLTAVTDDGEDRFLQIPLSQDNKTEQVGGIAVRNGELAVSFVLENRLLVTNLVDGSWSVRPVDSPRGVAYDKDGSLYVLSGEGIVRFAGGKNAKAAKVPSPALPESRSIALSGKIAYVSCRGESHQVWAIDLAKGTVIRKFGRPGVPSTGKYDELHMNKPAEMCVDSRGQLWVTEQDYAPKRVSVWDVKTGSLVKAFYGPAKYGAGGTFDTKDPTLYYYDEGGALMEFRVDVPRAKWRLERVLLRAKEDRERMFRAPRSTTNREFVPPQRTVYVKGPKGEARFLSNAWNSSPTSGAGTTFLFSIENDRLEPVAAAGSANGVAIFTNAVYDARWAEIDAKATRLRKGVKHADATYLWSDLNGDHAATPDEVQFVYGHAIGLTVLEGGAICIAVFRRGKASEDGESLVLEPVSTTAAGVPVWDFAKAKTVFTGVRSSPSSGGNQLVRDARGNCFLTCAAGPLPNYSVSGGREGSATWAYPNMWPGLHAGHRAARTDSKEQLTAPTRLLGPALPVPGTDLSLVALNGNHGEIYLFTSEGMLFDTVLRDARFGRVWRFSDVQIGRDMTDVSPYDEHFWPTINQFPDGSFHLIAGKDATSILRLDNVDSLVRLAPVKMRVTAEDVRKVAAEEERLAAAKRDRDGTGILALVRGEAPEVDGDLSDWDPATFVPIENRGAKAYFNANSQPYDIRGALRTDGKFLYVAWKTDGVKDLAANSGENPTLQFKTGGGCDLMLAAGGGLRLLASMVPNEIDRKTGRTKTWKSRVMLYEKKVPGVKPADRVPFASPVSTITFDRVRDVTDHVRFVGGKSGFGYELAVPLDLVHLPSKASGEMRGDIGVLRGSVGETMARSYWSNKATAIVSDVPSEADLRPANWGPIRAE